MGGLTTALALACAGVNLLAGAVGAWHWWQVTTGRLFWPLARAGQAVAVALALLAGVLAATGADPDSGLFWLYALLPVAVAFIAEQLRVASAQTVLDARDLEDAQAMRGLPEAAQRSVVLAIVRREMGVVAAAAFVLCFLALRAAMETGGI
jgi:hypothetical protein